jgi:hypothetical protein
VSRWRECARGGGFHPKWQILSDIAGPSKDFSEKCRGGAGGSVHTKFEVAVGDGHENEPGRALVRKTEK